mmetsp:Transcript_17466/g.38262  ORF Transcript_17466/g.38262 Transcript_17466/m.38262 type:complete len:280 (-) Transcript_17466:194-1033(-)|eukprot:CAMPEP_0170617180 /NCGR_PEP_ID=MMETSP0224-20130122/26274_1 /TAXON_ID=285029 /ORGANISM="Togula jolla, Strain CCCM 725" /LENGTH=279 /DNA_ID=CAMNT_0010943043 /DNA_START=17 /DNA_END=856 /DNA_ORIENTATION=-
MAEADLFSALRRVVAEYVDSQVERKISKLVASDADKASRIEKLSEKVEELSDRKRSRDSGVSSEQLEKLVAEMKQMKEQMDRLAVEVTQAKEMAQKQGELTQVVTDINNRVNALNAPQITAAMGRMNMIGTQLAQMNAKSNQFAGQVQQLASELQNVRMNGGGGGSPDGGMLEQKVQHALSMCHQRMDQLANSSAQWYDVDLDNVEPFDAFKVYRMQNGDGWMYGSVIHSSCIYFNSTTGQDDVVVIFSQSKRLPMQRSVGAAISSMTAYPPARLQYRG